ncbi:hypothetical protein ACF1AB_40970 [Streptomyces sp. NPDC014846]|uniref:hypothetical protein n=1 Tax=Streptomyces sp. NPDC014846 TaxID=3364922 RepID=UPI0037013E09
MPDDESTDPTPRAKAHELARLYLDTLENLMDPAEYTNLRVPTLASLAAMTEPIDPHDARPERHLDIDLTPAVHDEWLTLMGILGSGRMDQQIVAVGDGSRTVADSEVAADPEALRALCAQVRERNRLRQEERDTLDGTKTASD